MAIAGQAAGRTVGPSTQIVPIIAAGGFAVIIVQALIDSSRANIICSVITVAMAALTFGYCLRPATLYRFPLSTLTIIGYNVTTMTLALVAQTGYLQPVTFNLQFPVRTFELTAILQVVLLAAHAFYAGNPFLNRMRTSVTWRMLRPIGVFRMPAPAELWLLGLIGFGSIWYSRIIIKGDIDYGDASGRFLQALTPYAAAPFLIFLRRQFSLSPLRSAGALNSLMLGLYFLAIVLTGISGNRRTTFASVALTFLLAIVLMVGLRRVVISARAKYLLLIGLILGTPIIGMAQDLANAMVVARSAARHAASFGETIQETLNVYSDKSLLDEKVEQQNFMSGTHYSEFYIRNPFLQRLTYTKFTDIMVNASHHFGPSQVGAVRREFWAQFWSMLPTPVLAILHIDVDKSTTAHSAGDFYDSLAYGEFRVSFLVGSSIVDSMIVFGPWWIPAMFIVFVFSIFVIDIFALPTRAGVVLSPIAFLQLYFWFTRAVVADSVAQILGVIFRGTIQTIFLYMVLIVIARMFSFFLMSRREPVHAPRSA